MLPKIIDMHVHPFLCGEDNTALRRYGGPETPEDFVSELRRAGISMACGSVIRPVSGADFGELRAMNDVAVEFSRRFPDFFIPGIHIHSGHIEESCREIERMNKIGVRLVGELVPYMMGYSVYATREAFPIYELIEEYGMILSIHPTNDEDIENIMREFPRLPVIVAHPGEKEDFDVHLDRMKRYENAYLDICGTGLFRNNLLRYGIDRAGAERFLFGTDFPICNPAMQVHGVLYEKLTDAEKEAILSGNFLRLFKIGK
jgi:predicted TIM-barrel fold metal-dependent hydrolase